MAYFLVRINGKLTRTERASEPMNRKSVRTIVLKIINVNSNFSCY